MRSCPLLVFANKQDLPGAMSEEEIAKGLGLIAENEEKGETATQTTSRPWKIQVTCALEGRGLWEGLDWLVKAVKEHKWFIQKAAQIP